MFGFNKKAGASESLFVNVLICGTILSSLAKLTYDSFLDTNRLTIISGENHGVKIEVNTSTSTSEACGRLGCFNMPNVTFSVERREVSLLGQSYKPSLLGFNTSTYLRQTTIFQPCITNKELKHGKELGFNGHHQHQQPIYVPLLGTDMHVHGVVPTLAQCGLETSHTPLNLFTDVYRFPHDVFLHRKAYENDHSLRNLTVKYLDAVTIDCEIDSDSKNSIIYWVGSRKDKLFQNGSYFYMEGYFYENFTSVNERYQLSLQNVSGYEDRYFTCILFEKNKATIKYSYLTVLGDPVISHYTDERFDENKNDNPTAHSLRNSQLAGIIAAALVLFLTIMIIIGITVYRRRNSSVIVKYWLKKVTVEKPLSESGDLVMPIVRIEKQRLTQVGIIGNDTTLMSEYQMPVDAQWEIPRSKISLTGQVLGEGEFGKVIKAESHGLVSEDVKTIVAVKMLKDGYTDADMVSLVSEMEIMKMIGKHENIINLLGCCTQDGPLYVVVEYARNGCLRDYLKRHKPQRNGSMDNLLDKFLTPRDLTGFVWQVAKGMEYLASRGCIHRDLAARNVLVSEDLILKIADFGLARDVRDSDYYRKRTAGKLPMKWMAPESMAQNYYDKRSDVWSFGIITWEIMTFGEIPYAKISVYKLYNHLETNNRLEHPADCSDEMYDLMMSCWAFKPENRPTFEDIVGTMKTMLNLPENGPPLENLNEYVTMLS